MIAAALAAGLLFISLPCCAEAPLGSAQRPALRGDATALRVPAESRAPVLSFPEPGVDDTAAYQGYKTRFYRDSRNNAVQIYLQPPGSRVVLVWADAANESVGFTLRDPAGRPARLDWGAEEAEVADSGSTRSIEYQLAADAPRVQLGLFVLGSMRVERDFQYDRRHLKPFTGPPFRVAEESLLVATLTQLPADEQARQLEILGADSVATLRRRLDPTLAIDQADSTWVASIRRPSLDGRNHLTLEIRVNRAAATARIVGRTFVVASRSTSPVRLRVRVTTDAAPLTPLSRTDIFTPAFLQFLARARDTNDPRYRRLEREVRGVELLSSKEKLMAGLPNFATYFGRDMLMTALMMRPIWSEAISEHVISSALRKLGPAGDVSHEEALAGQAIRENARVYDSLVTLATTTRRGGRPERADSMLARAREVLAHLQATRENYFMRDDEFQLPVLAARYLADTAVSAGRKRAFLLDSSDGGVARLTLLIRELGLVANETRPYADDPRPTNLVSFPRRDSTHWRSASWRDSDAGYAGGRFAMDINAIWAGHALEAIATILATLPQIGFDPAALTASAPEIAAGALGGYVRNPATLRRAIDVWSGARRHFEVVLAPAEIDRRLRAKLAWLPASERRYWQGVLASAGEVRDSLPFLALALDTDGRPIPVVNTDPVTELFLASPARAAADSARRRLLLRDLAPIVRPYPVGLFVAGLGPLVANDAYASHAIWERFRNDAYHSPRVVWGREVNLLFLGLADQIIGAADSTRRPDASDVGPYVHALNAALQSSLAAVKQSGLEHNELWSYQIRGEKLLPVRYGTSSDVQLWNTTDLVVQYVLSGLPRP